MRILLVAALCFTICACQKTKKSDENGLDQPFWTGLDLDLGKSPNRFCARSERLLSTTKRARNFVCEDRLQGALGARIDSQGYRIVLIQGVGEKWFLFAHVLPGNEPPVDFEDLERVEILIHKEFVELR